MIRALFSTLVCTNKKAMLRLVLGISGVTICTVGSADTWPQFRGPNRDGTSKEKGVWTKIGDQDPKLDWIAEGVGAGYASVSVTDDYLLTSGNVGNTQAVTAIATGTGKVVWSTPISDSAPKHGYEGSRTTPTVDGNLVYAVSSDGRIVCLSLKDGKEVWQHNFREWKGKMMSGWGFSESPLVDGDLVLCTPGANDALIVALDKKTGKEVWKTALDDTSKDSKQLNDGAGYASIVISNGGGVKQYVQLVGRGVVGVRASDGKLLWRYTGVGNTTANIPTVIASQNNIFCSTVTTRVPPSWS